MTRDEENEAVVRDLERSHPNLSGYIHSHVREEAREREVRDLEERHSTTREGDAMDMTPYRYAAEILINGPRTESNQGEREPTEVRVGDSQAKRLGEALRDLADVCDRLEARCVELEAPLSARREDDHE